MKKISTLINLLKIYKVKDSVIMRIGEQYGYGGYVIPKKMLEISSTLYFYGKDSNKNFEEKFLKQYTSKKIEYLQEIDNNIPGVIVEFNEVSKNLDKIIEFLLSLKNNFSCVSIHGNNLYGLDYIEGYFIPTNLELVFVNNNHFDLEPDNSNEFDNFNMPSDPDFPDYPVNFDLSEVDNNNIYLNFINDTLNSQVTKIKNLKISHNSHLKDLQKIEELNKSLYKQLDSEEESLHILRKYKIAKGFIEVFKLIVKTMTICERAYYAIKRISGLKKR